MTVAELIKQLQALPQDIQVEVNDNNGGEVYSIEQVDYFGASLDQDDKLVVIQVNV
jgi:hypothetical protein